MPTVSVLNSENASDIKLVQEVDAGQTVFDGLSSKGYDLPHGCLAGSCGACRIFVVDGAENLTSMSVIEEDSVANVCKFYRIDHGDDSLNGKTVRLACRARVNGDIKIVSMK